MNHSQSERTQGDFLHSTFHNSVKFSGAKVTQDPTVITAVLVSIEVMLNRALALAPAAAAELQDYSRTLLAIECTAPALEVFVAVKPNGTLALSSYCEDEITTRIKGSFEEFLVMAVAEDPAATLINSDLEIAGNASLLLAIQQIIARMDLDWEAPLIESLGDVVGHQLAQILRGTFRWARKVGASFRRQLSEFILEEGRLSPPAAELECFYIEVERLTLRTERLQSRLQRLSEKIEEAVS